MPDSTNVRAANKPAGPAPTTITFFELFEQSFKFILTIFLGEKGSWIKTSRLSSIQCSLALASRDFFRMWNPDISSGDRPSAFPHWARILTSENASEADNFS